MKSSCKAREVFISQVYIMHDKCNCVNYSIMYTCHTFHVARNNGSCVHHLGHSLPFYPYHLQCEVRMEELGVGFQMQIELPI